MPADQPSPPSGANHGANQANQANPKSPFTRGFVIFCSAMLVGGYIYYRGAGAMSRLPSSKSGRVAPFRPETDQEQVVLPSSKSAAVIAPSTESPPALLPGSKSMPVVDTSKILRGDATGGAPPTQPSQP